jgi:hypothetical protein
METKFCQTCQTELLITNFGKKSEACKKCKRLEVQKRYREKNKEKLLEAARIYRTEKKERKQCSCAEYRQKNRQKIRLADKIYREKKAQNFSWKISRTISKAIWDALQKKNSSKKGISWEELVGYTRDELKFHLESKFTPEMTWENYGSYWHVDHIMPKSWFEYSSVEDENFKKCWGLANLQPLSAKENLSKHNRWAG